MNPTDYLRLGVEQYLRELPDDEFTDLIARVRPPDHQWHTTNVNDGRARPVGV